MMVYDLRDFVARNWDLFSLQHVKPEAFVMDLF